MRPPPPPSPPSSPPRAARRRPRPRRPSAPAPRPRADRAPRPRPAPAVAGKLALRAERVGSRRTVLAGAVARPRHAHALRGGPEGRRPVLPRRREAQGQAGLAAPERRQGRLPDRLHDERRRPGHGARDARRDAGARDRQGPRTAGHRAAPVRGLGLLPATIRLLQSASRGSATSSAGAAASTGGPPVRSSPSGRTPDGPHSDADAAVFAKPGPRGGRLQGEVPRPRAPRRGRHLQAGPRADRREREGRAHLPDLLGQGRRRRRSSAPSGSTARTTGRTARDGRRELLPSAGTRSTATARSRPTTRATAACGCRCRTRGASTTGCATAPGSTPTASQRAANRASKPRPKP